MTRPSSWQQCEDCETQIDDLSPEQRCPSCNGLLAIMHGIVPDPARRKRLAENTSPSGVWRFGELVLPAAVGMEISFPEGNTPLVARPALSGWCELPGLLVKHEGMNPTGSFKDRGMTVAITQARRVHARAVACASTGNTSASMAAYAAQAGIPALAIIPDGQITIGKLGQTLAYGARTLLVDGDFDACLRLMQEASASLGVYLLNSINPFRIEGQKTIVFEILQRLDWQAPDWIVLPAGNLGNTAAFGKAIAEAFALGLIDRKPRIVAVQAAGAAPFAAAYREQFAALHPVHAETIATAIKIGAPASYQRAVRAIQDTNGVVVDVTDEQIVEAKAMVDRSGLGCEPASAASIAGVRLLRRHDVIGRHDNVVAVLTGHLLKDPSIVQQIHSEDSIAPRVANLPVRIPASVDAVAEILDVMLRLR